MNYGRDNGVFLLLRWLFPSFIFSYFAALLVCNMEINRNENFEKKEKAFWRRIIFKKTVSGITAFCFLINKKIKFNHLSIIIALFHHTRMILFFMSLILITIWFLINIAPQFLVVCSFFFFLYLIIDLIYDTMVLIHVSQKDKKEWEDYNYYYYFTSLKSFFNPFGYKDYYKKHLRNTK